MKQSTTKGRPDTLKIAREYVGAGLGVVPVKADGTKQAAVRWKEFQSRLATDAELVRWFKDGKNGIAIVCGAVSGNLELIDFDEESERIFFEYRETVTTEMPGLWEKLSCCQTPRGIHVRYRIEGEVPGGNAVLARDENITNGRPFIETRGEGGYALAPGCPSGCHQSGIANPYAHLSGRPLTDLAIISKEERAYLIETARKWNIAKEAKPNQWIVEAKPFKGKVQGGEPGLSPGDDFDQRATWNEVLSPAGWTIAKKQGGLTFWKRPGSDNAYGATTGMRENGLDLLHVFTSGSDFEEKRNYGKFRAYAVLNHNGNESAAAKELHKRGYGRLGNQPKAENSKPKQDASELTFATIADLARIASELQWLWPGWLQKRAINCLASDPGTGKTRCAFDLIRRVRHGLPWPDSSMMELPTDYPVAIMLADNNHAEAVELCGAFEIDPATITLVTSQEEPFGGTDLDSSETLASLRELVSRHPEGILIVVDTVGAATRQDLTRAEQAKALLKPLSDLATSSGATLLLLHHLNASGGTLGRRIEQHCRVVLKMIHPDPENEPDRRWFGVTKTNSKKPMPLGITMQDNGNHYDANPPELPGNPAPGRPRAARQSAASWLRNAVAHGAEFQSSLIAWGRERGFSESTLQRAADSLGIERSGKPKVWSLPAKRAD